MGTKQSISRGERKRLRFISATHMVNALSSSESPPSLSVTVGLQSAGVRKVGGEGGQSLCWGSHGGAPVFTVCLRAFPKTSFLNCQNRSVRWRMSDWFSLASKRPLFVKIGREDC